MSASPSSSASSRRVPLQVLNLSMPKTGSLSMKAALEILDLPTYHGFEFMERKRDQSLWERAIDAKYYGKGQPFGRKEFDGFLGDWAALSDFPMLGFSEEMIKAYPEAREYVRKVYTKCKAKVILIERDMDKWFPSFCNGVVDKSYTWQAQLLEHYIEPHLSARPATLIQKMEYAWFRCDSQDSFKANAKQIYSEHYAMVRSLVPKERLLEYRLGSGWTPLCEFLGKEIPDEEFPWLNETKEYDIWMYNTQMKELKRGLLTLSKYIVIPGLAIGAAWWWRRL